MRRTLVALLAVVLLLGLGGAHAAQLQVSAGSLTTVTAGHPCPGTLATQSPGAGTTFTAVRVTTPAGCAGRTVRVAVGTGATAPQGSAVLPAVGVTVDVPLSGSYTATADLVVQATVAGWHMPTTWTWTAPTASAWCTVLSGPTTGGCQVTVALRRTFDLWTWSWTYYYDVTVTTTANGWVEWQVGLLLDHPFYRSSSGFTRATHLGNSDLDGAGEVERSSACSTLPVVLLDGPGSGSPANQFRGVRSGTTRTFSLVVNETGRVEYQDLLAPGCV